VRRLLEADAEDVPGSNQYEAVIKTKAGDLRHIEFYRNVTLSPNRTRVSILVRDITRRRRATDLAEGLLKTSKRLSARLEPDPLLAAIAQEAVALGGARAGFAARKHGDQFTAGVYVVDDQSLPLEVVFPLEMPRIRQLATEQRPFSVSPDDPDWSPTLPADAPKVRSMAAFPILDREQRLIGFIELHDSVIGTAFSQGDLDRVGALSQIAAIALENALAYLTLQEADNQLRASEERLRTFSARLEAARERERSRIAREVHDELGQALTGLKMDAVWLRDRMEAGPIADDAVRLRKRTKAMADLIDETIETVRRIATELRPGVLDDLGLVAAVEWQVGEFTKRSGIPCSLTTNIDQIDLPGQVATGAFRILQEALTNVARHAEASQVRVRLKHENSWIRLEVEDDGVGLGHGEPVEGLGLVGIRERAGLLGGAVDIESQPDGGTRVAVRLPTEPSDQEEAS